MTGDRRTYPREACLITAHVRQGKRIYEGTVLNICEDGAFVATPAPFDEDVQVQLRFRHPRTDETVQARAVVARRIPPGSGQSGLGLKLIDDLCSLEAAQGAVASASGTWTRPDAASHSGGWRNGNLSAPPILAPAPEPDRVGAEERRSPPRASTPGLRVRVQAPGELPGAGALLDATPNGVSVATDRPPRVGRLVRLELDSHEGSRQPSIEVTCKVIWHREEVAFDGKPMAFGAQILQFGGSDSRLRYEAFIVWLARRAAATVKVR